jgi:hypothetical protein
MIVPGFTFLSETPSSSTEHLYVILFPPVEGRVLFVNVTTPKHNSDLTCVLKVGDHPFLTHDSVINYADSADATLDQVNKAISLNVFKPHAPFSADLLKRVQEGATTSQAFPPKFRKYIPPQGPI